MYLCKLSEPYSLLPPPPPQTIRVPLFTFSQMSSEPLADVNSSSQKSQVKHGSVSSTNLFILLHIRMILSDSGSGAVIFQVNISTS